ncbi:protein of unknown function [Saccharicrinis carchari]|uniref:F5/8 type C domain-containing protein n=1 Tax=Saccharicrinis carchari TaxID=1168039 RepID=A0A521BYE7_SACCC|nr:discoidin domain-containing protein [Saccharicrinis carchari]SMO52193.1 protein of unknown function [Saccharicrinis carchari]
MNKILISLFLMSLLIAFTNCDNDKKTEVPFPSQISDIKTEPRVGGVLLSWDIPQDSNYFYVQTRYEKNGRTIKTNSSIFTDSVVIGGLLNKFEYVFEVQAFNEDLVGNEVLTTSAVRPIRRGKDITYQPESNVDIELTDDMIDTYTQESSEGPKKNLLDGNINSYWHTAWSSGVAPLPHWIQINFDEPTEIGGMRYTFRQNGDENGRPSQWDLQVSDDGNAWTTVWTSEENLPTSPVASTQTLLFGERENFSSQYFRLRILANPGNRTYTHLSTISIFKKGLSVVDLEEEAERNYQ